MSFDSNLNRIESRPAMRELLANTSVIHPPEDITSNFVDPETRTVLLVSSASALLGLAMLFYINRIYVKLCLMRRVTWDDATLLLAVVISIVYYVSCVWAAQKGYMARHLWDINLLQVQSPHLLITTYIQFVLSPIALVFLKGTFFILYLKLFESLRWVRISCWIMLCSITSIHTALGIYSFMIASPYRSDWALKAEWIGFITAILGLAVDIVILVIPIIAISKLELLSTKKKCGALAVFLTGGLACLAAAFSIEVRWDLKNKADKTWIDVIVNIATLCELFVGIMCACAPSVSYGFKNTNSVWQRMYRRTRSLRGTLSSSGSSPNGISGHQISIRETRPISNILRSTDRKYAKYFELNENSTKSSLPPHQELQRMTPAHIAPSVWHPERQGKVGQGTTWI